MTRPLLEICVDTAAGMKAAIDGGADRIELCAALAVGGLTPSAGLMQLTINCGVPVRAMIRPREGDFTYSQAELAVMFDDIDAAANHGLEGVVFCANHPDGKLDEAILAGLVDHARNSGLSVAMHRGFDLAHDPLAALETAIDLGVSTVLTSGGARTAPYGVSGLARLVTAASGRIEILAGAGVTADNACSIAAVGVTSFHASCSRPVPIVTGRAVDLGYVTNAQRDTDRQLVSTLRQTLDSLEISHVVC